MIILQSRKDVCKVLNIVLSIYLQCPAYISNKKNYIYMYFLNDTSFLSISQEPVISHRQDGYY